MILRLVREGWKSVYTPMIVYMLGFESVMILHLVHYCVHSYKQ